MKKDYWQEIHRFMHKTPDDVLLAEVFLEIKRKKEKEAKKARIESTREHYLKEKKESPAPVDGKNFLS